MLIASPSAGVSPVANRLPASLGTTPSPTKLAQVGTGAKFAGGVALDLLIGTHWAVRHRLHAQRRLRALSQEDAHTRDHLRALAARPSTAPGVAAARHHAEGLLRLNGQVRKTQLVRRDVYGGVLGVGFVALGAGLSMQAPGLGSFVPALLALSAPVMLAATPLVGAAAAGVATYDACRAAQTYRVQARLAHVTADAVSGNEVLVQALLQQRLDVVRQQAMIKSGSLFGIAAGVPLLLAGLGPGCAVIVPSGLGLLYAVHLGQNKVRYTRQLTHEERLGLTDRREVINRIALAHAEYAALKALKSTKRAVYPHGAEVPYGLGALIQLWARWHLDGAGPMPPAKQVVAAYLVAQAQAQQAYDAAQMRVAAHRGAPGTSPAGRTPAARFAAGIRLAPASPQDAPALARRLLRGASSGASPQAPGASGGAAILAQRLLRFVAAHGLGDALCARLCREPAARQALLAMGALVYESSSWRLRGDRLEALLATELPRHAQRRAWLAEQLCEAGEHVLLVTEKRRAQYRQRELLDILAERVRAKPLPVPGRPASRGADGRELALAPAARFNA